MLCELRIITVSIQYEVRPLRKCAAQPLNSASQRENLRYGVAAGDKKRPPATLFDAWDYSVRKVRMVLCTPYEELTRAKANMFKQPMVHKLIEKV